MATGLGLAIGLLAGGVFVVATYVSPLLGLGLLGAVPLALVTVFRPRIGLWAFVFLLLVLEEFPSGMGETLERATRLPFYGTSLGVPGLYATDVFLGGLIASFLLHTLIARRSPGFTVDRITLALGALGVVVVAAAGLTYWAGNPLDVTVPFSDVPFEVSDRGVRYVAFFQFKIYAYLFIAYILGQQAFTAPRFLSQLCHVFLGAALVNVGVGCIRLVMRPNIVAETIPLFYHSPTSWIFALTICFIGIGWVYGRWERRTAIGLALLSAVLFVFIIISFRRAMWGATLLAAVGLVPFLPARAVARLTGVLVVVTALILPPLLFTPAGPLVGGAVAERVAETSVSDASTLARLAAVVHVSRHFWDFPLLGYGARPLWDRIMQLGEFRISLENVHSLYFWWLFRTGLVGLAVGLTAIAFILAHNIRLVRRTRYWEFRVFGLTILFAFLMLLLSGLVNPVYGEARYMILMGLGLALLSRMQEWETADRTRVRNVVLPGSRMGVPRGG